MCFFFSFFFFSKEKLPPFHQRRPHPRLSPARLPPLSPLTLPLSICRRAGGEGHFLRARRLGLPPMQRGIPFHEGPHQGSSRPGPKAKCGALILLGERVNSAFFCVSQYHFAVIFDTTQLSGDNDTLQFLVQAKRWILSELTLVRLCWDSCLNVRSFSQCQSRTQPAGQRFGPVHPPHP